MGVSTRSWYFIRDKYQFDGRLENNSLRKNFNRPKLRVADTAFDQILCFSPFIVDFSSFCFILFYFIYNYGRTKTKWKISDSSGIP